MWWCLQLPMCQGELGTAAAWSTWLQEEQPLLSNQETGRLKPSAHPKVPAPGSHTQTSHAKGGKGNQHAPGLQGRASASGCWATWAGSHAGTCVPKPETRGARTNITLMRATGRDRVRKQWIGEEIGGEEGRQRV